MYMTKAPDDSVTRYDPTLAYEGYTLFAPHGGTDAWLIDMEGRICHRWRLASRPGSGMTLLPNGNLFCVFINADMEFDKVQQLDETITTKATIADFQRLLPDNPTVQAIRTK